MGQTGCVGGGSISADVTKMAFLACAVTNRDIPDKPEQMVNQVWITKQDRHTGMDLMAQGRLSLTLRHKMKYLLWRHTAGSLCKGWRRREEKTQTRAYETGPQRAISPSDTGAT